MGLFVIPLNHFQSNSVLLVTVLWLSCERQRTFPLPQRVGNRNDFPIKANFLQAKYIPIFTYIPIPLLPIAWVFPKNLKQLTEWWVKTSYFGFTSLNNNWPSGLAILCKKEVPKTTLFLSVLQLMIWAVVQEVPLHTRQGWCLPQPPAHLWQVGRPVWERKSR